MEKSTVASGAPSFAGGRVGSESEAVGMLLVFLTNWQHTGLEPNEAPI